MFDINFFGNKKNETKSLTTVRDRPIKSIAKAVSWRIVGSIDTIFISYLLTGKIKIAFSIGGVEVFTKIFLYFVHERIWEAIRWGRMMVIIRRNSRSAQKSITRMVINSKDLIYKQ